MLYGQAKGGLTLPPYSQPDRTIYIFFYDFPQGSHPLPYTKTDVLFYILFSEDFLLLLYYKYIIKVSLFLERFVFKGKHMKQPRWSVGLERRHNTKEKKHVCCSCCVCASMRHFPIKMLIFGI